MKDPECPAREVVAEPLGTARPALGASCPFVPRAREKQKRQACAECVRSHFVLEHARRAPRSSDSGGVDHSLPARVRGVTGLCAERVSATQALRNIRGGNFESDSVRETL